MKIRPWHTRDSAVHHIDTDCPRGQTVALVNRIAGTGRRPICFFCEHLAQQRTASRARRARNGINELSFCAIL